MADCCDKAIEELLHWLLDPKAIDGAIRSAIHAHGPVTRVNSFSTSKRVRGAMKTRAAEFLQREQEKKIPDQV